MDNAITFDDLNIDFEDVNLSFNVQYEVSELPCLHNLRNFLRGHVPESALSYEDKKMLGFIPKTPNGLTAFETVEFLNQMADSLDYPDFIYRNMNVLIQKKYEDIDRASEATIKELYNFVNYIDSRFFVGFVQDELLPSNVNAMCEKIEIYHFHEVDVVLVRNSLINEKNILHYCKSDIANAILSYRHITFYHRKIIFSLLKIRFPDLEQKKFDKKEASVKVTASSVGKKRKEVEKEKLEEIAISFKKFKNDEWCSSEIGIDYTYAWKLVFIRNSPVRLSEKGQKEASNMRNNDGNVKTNGKSYEADYARTFEHFLHLITHIKDKKYKNVHALMWILKMYTIFKLYRAFELQVRFSNSPDEPDVVPMENSRKSKEFVITKEECKIRRTMKDQDDLHNFYDDFMEEAKIKKKSYVLPSQKEVYDICMQIIERNSVESIVRLKQYDWDSTIEETDLSAWNDFKLLSKIIAMYTALIRKAPSFQLEVEKEMIEIPILLGTNKDDFQTKKNNNTHIIKKIFGKN